jgi:4-amino-4-deoxy-L-arabinose transferase-like glycosyltransferase
VRLAWASFRDERSRGARTLAWTVIGAFTLVMLGTCAINVRSLSMLRDSDFPHFYFAARALLQGQDIYASHSQGYIYPPLFALLLAPIALLERGPAGALWTALSCGLAVGSVWLVGRETCERLRVASTSLFFWATGALVHLANIDKLRVTINGGQTDTLTFFLIALAYRLERRFPLLCGACLGVACNIKYHTVVFLAYFLARGRLRESAGMALGIALGALAAAPLVGWGVNLDYLARAFQGFPQMLGLVPKTPEAAQMNQLTWMPSVSITSGLARVIGHREHPTLFFASVALVALLAFCAGWWIYARRGVALFAGRWGAAERREPNASLSLLEWSGLLVATVLFSPQSTGRHYYITTLMLCMNVAVLLTPRAGVPRWPTIVGWLVFFLGLTLPPGMDALEGVLRVWRYPASPGWCVLIGFMIMAHQYLRWLGAPDVPPDSLAQEVRRA